jgi:hypothetical protein
MTPADLSDPRQVSGAKFPREPRVGDAAPCVLELFDW